MISNKLGLVLAFLFASNCVNADSAYITLEQRLTADQFKQTGLNTLTAKQLALLNSVLNEQETHVVETAVAEATVAAMAAASSAQPPMVAPASATLLSTEPFNSKVVGSIQGWQTGTVFNLENGQQWQVNKGSAKLFETLDNPVVKVNISLVGKWYFEFNEDLPKAMVTRIK